MRLSALRLIVFVSGLILLAAGCGSTVGSRDLARETLMQVMEYQDTLIRVQRVMAKGADSTQELEAQLKIAALVTSDTRTSRLASDAVDVAMDRGFRDRDFRNFISDSITADSVDLTRAASTLAQLADQPRALSKQIQSQLIPLKSLRARLEKLQIEPSWGDSIEQLRSYYKVAREAYDRARAEAIGGR